MGRAGAGVEVEVKLPLDSAAQGRRLLRRAGFRLLHRRVHEDNLVFDDRQGKLRAAGLLLRLRTAGGKCTLTFKGPAASEKHKSRPEFETTVADPEGIRAILEGLGLRPVFRYEKYRAEFLGRDRQGVVTLDETPIGVFFELEGPPAWIDSTARLLGLGEDLYIIESYADLYMAHCIRRHLPVRDMVFPPSPH